jgi:hypothetical protein
MTSPTNHTPVAQTAQHTEFSLERISRLVTELEQELAKAPSDMPNAGELKEEIASLKSALASRGDDEGGIRERLHAVRSTLRNVSAEVEGEVLKDTPYITEIGRILGMV